MAYKKFLLASMLFLFGIFLFAQTPEMGDAALDEAEIDTEGMTEEEQLNYFLDLTGREPRFIQRLSWEIDGFVLRYVVIIEQRGRDGSFIEIERLDTVTNFVEVSLVAGVYRYSVEVYDLFDDLAYTTEWFNVEVLRALQPSVTGFSPNTFYLDEDVEWIITVRGRSFVEESEFLLVENNSRIRPINTTIDGNTARLEFSGGSLSPGEYDILIRNPGGLEGSSGTFVITNRKQRDLNLSLSYAPVIPLYGFLFKEFEYMDKDHEAPFPDTFFPLSGSVRISFLPVKRVWGNMGLELTGSFTMLSHERETYAANAFLINSHASLLYQKHFLMRTFFVNVSIGAGLFTLLDFYYKYDDGESDKESASYFSAIGGLSFTYMFVKPWFFTIGADYLHAFVPEKESPMLGTVRPYLAFGVQL